MPRKTSILDNVEELSKPGEKPHEFLMRVASGQPIIQSIWKYTYFKFGPRAGDLKEKELIEEEIYPTFQERMEAAKAAAPFFAPKLASTTVKEDKVQVFFDDDFGGQDGKNQA